MWVNYYCSLLIFICPGLTKSNIQKNIDDAHDYRKSCCGGTLCVIYWYGIPYAEQPIGHLRWKPPQPLAKTKGTKNVNLGIPLTESCLTLNVYAPDNARHLPVLCLDSWR